jgi:hypothetical protein
VAVPTLFWPFFCLEGSLSEHTRQRFESNYQDRFSKGTYIPNHDLRIRWPSQPCSGPFFVYQVFHILISQVMIGYIRTLPLARRVQLAVVAHVRHVYTDYDRLLKTTSFHEVSNHGKLNSASQRQFGGRPNLVLALFLYIRFSTSPPENHFIP